MFGRLTPAGGPAIKRARSGLREHDPMRTTPRGSDKGRSVTHSSLSGLSATSEVDPRRSSPPVPRRIEVRWATEPAAFGPYASRAPRETGAVGCGATPMQPSGSPETAAHRFAAHHTLRAAWERR